MSKIGDTITCACGCGEEFTKKRRHHIFKSVSHRNNYHNSRLRGVIKQCRKLKKWESLDSVINHIEVLLNMEEKQSE